MKLWKNLVERVRVRLVALILPDILGYHNRALAEVEAVRVELVALSGSIKATGNQVDDLTDRVRDFKIDLRDMEDRLDDLPSADDLPDYDELIERAVYALQDYIPDAEELTEEAVSEAHDHTVDWIVEALQNYPRR